MLRRVGFLAAVVITIVATVVTWVAAAVTGAALLWLGLGGGGAGPLVLGVLLLAAATVAPVWALIP